MNTSLPARLRVRGSLLLTQAALIACCTFTTVPAGATTIRPQPLAELVGQADTIVIGHARSAESVWVGRNLYTRYRVEVQETLLGTPTHEVSVLVEGGVDMNRKHPIAMSVADAPVLLQGERMALLLKRGSAIGDVAHHIVGFNQGRISLALPAGQAEASSADNSTGRARRLNRVRAQLQSLVAARPQSGAVTPAPSAPSARPRIQGR